MLVSDNNHKNIHTIQFKLVVCTYWVSVQSRFVLWTRWPICDPQWPKNNWKRWSPSIIWKSLREIQFKLDVYTYWVSVQNRFALGPRWPNFGHLVAKKLLKMVVSDHYLNKSYATQRMQIRLHRITTRDWVSVFSSSYFTTSYHKRVYCWRNCYQSFKSSRVIIQHTSEMDRILWYHFPVTVLVYYDFNGE